VAARALEAPGWRRIAACAGLAAILGVNLSWWILRIRAASYQKDFVPVAEFLRPRLAGLDEAICTPAVSFGLGFPSNCRQDASVLMRAGGPPVIAVSSEWWNDFVDSKNVEPQTYAHRRARLETEYRPVYSTARFRVFMRRNRAD